MFLGILEFRVENIRLILEEEKTVITIRSQICGDGTFLSRKTTLKSAKITGKKQERVNNLWRILGIKLIHGWDF